MELGRQEILARDRATPSGYMHQKTTSLSLRRTMADEERGGNSAPVFKKKSKVRGAGGAPSALSRTSLLDSNEQDGQGGGVEEEGAVQRSDAVGARRRHGARESKARKGGTAAALSFSETGAEPSFELRKSALSLAAKGMAPAVEASLPDSLDQASIAGASNGYSPSVLASLKASTPARRRNGGESGGGGELDDAHQDMLDPTAQIDEHGNSLAGLKFGADFAQQGIPSEALVAAAKERRRRAAGVDGDGDGDFISLRDGPHPESRLQREEDDVGSGEEEFAEFTGATERVALGKQAILEAKKREREERREAMDVDSDSDDSGREWERAQMGRIDGGASRKQREKRERSPFRPARIPMTAPLPTLTSTSARLAALLGELESSVKSHGQVVDDAVRQLQQLEDDEKRNKASTQVAGEKEAWFRELEEFMISLSAFLDDKMPQLEEIEIEWRGLLVERAALVQRARALSMTDEASLFHGVPARSLLPKAAGTEDGPAVQDEDVPASDGGPLSVIRETRRASAPHMPDVLPPADEAAFQVAQKDIQRRTRQLLDDVKAPEFTDPAVRVDGRLHPSSLVTRFSQWRALYTDEYANAWGGLTLAGVWDFWVRKDMCGWDVVKAGGYSLDGFSWHRELTRYAAANDGSGEPTSALGGDDEVTSHVLCNTVMPAIIVACERGAYDPWIPADCRSMTELLEQVGYVLERDNARFQSLVSAFLHLFEAHILAVVDAMSSPAVVARPPFDPRSPPSLLAFLGRLRGLLNNLALLHRFVPSSERPFYLDLIDRLVGGLICNLLEMATETAGAREIARDVLTRCSRASLLRENVSARLNAMAA